jgi:Nicotinate phosphoribosyltransferase C-terminal domain
LYCVMRAGQLVEPRPTLAAARVRHTAEMAHLPAPYRRVQGGEAYPVRLSAGLAARQRQVEAALQQQGHAAGVVTEVKERSCQ